MEEKYDKLIDLSNVKLNYVFWFEANIDYMKVFTNIVIIQQLIAELIKLVNESTFYFMLLS